MIGVDVSSNKRAPIARVLMVLALLAGCHSSGRAATATSTSDVSTAQSTQASTTTRPSTTTTSSRTALTVAVGRAQDRDLMVTVRATPSRVGYGNPVRFDTVVTGLRVDDPYAVTVQFGDGTGDFRPAAGCASSGQTTSAELPAPLARTKSDSRSHIFSKRGTYSATVDVLSGYACASTSWARRAIATVNVSVT